MDPIEIRESRVGTGRAEVVTDAPVVAGAPVVAAPVGASEYAETRVVNPAWHRISQAIWLVVGIINVVLAMDFIFRALGANNVGFAKFIYSIGGALGAPFDGIFGNTINDNGAGTVGIDRWADLMAIAIYSLVAVAIIQVVRLMTTPKDSVSSSRKTVV